jgi:hypothetical protein
MSIKCAYGDQPIPDQITMIKRGGIHTLCATPDVLSTYSRATLIECSTLDASSRQHVHGFKTRPTPGLQFRPEPRWSLPFPANA